MVSCVWLSAKLNTTLSLLNCSLFLLWKFWKEINDVWESPRIFLGKFWEKKASTKTGHLFSPPEWTNFLIKCWSRKREPFVVVHWNEIAHQTTHQKHMDALICLLAWHINFALWNQKRPTCVKIFFPEKDISCWHLWTMKTFLIVISWKKLWKTQRFSKSFFWKRKRLQIQEYKRLSQLFWPANKSFTKTALTSCQRKKLSLCQLKSFQLLFQRIPNRNPQLYPASQQWL